MIELLRPKAFLPIHGTLHHLHRHAQLAKSLGGTNVLIAENGDLLELGSAGLQKRGVVDVGKVATFYGEEIPRGVLKQREQLGRQGAAFLVVVTDARGNLTKPPLLRVIGILDDIQDADVLRSAVDNVTMAFSRRPFTTKVPTEQQIIEVAERAVQRSLDGITSQRPLIVVQVVRT
jgi:ribonuclease J